MMKRFSLVFLLFPLVLCAQGSSIFEIDSLNTEGVTLDSAWKWHAGDNPDWAKADFDDSGWEAIDEVQQIPDMPQIVAAEIGWFRIHIDVDSLVLNNPLSASLSVMGAAEVYINEKLMKSIGIVSQNPNIEKAYHTPIPMFFNVLFSKQNDNVIAVRYSLSRSNFYFPKYVFTKSTPFELSLQQDATINEIQRGFINAVLNFVILIGVYFGLALTHFSFYYFLPSQKTNLLFGITMLFQGIFCLTFYYRIDMLSISEFTTFIFIRAIASICFYQLLALSVHSYLKQSLTKWFWIMLGITLLINSVLFTNINALLGSIIFAVSNAIMVVYNQIVLRKSMKAGNKDGLMVYYGGIICLIGFAIRIAIDTSIHLGILSPVYGFVGLIGLYILNFGITFGMFLTLARDFALTNNSLQVKQKEVQQLSTEKRRIAADMHDDIGSDLSALNLKAEMIRQKVKVGQQPMSEIDNLVGFSQEIAKKVREVIWTVNARHDSLTSVINYFDNYSDDFFEPTNIVVQTSLPPEIPQIDINGESRKMLLMCFKETLNNVLKHAKASELKIAYTIEKALFLITIEDNGIGFDPILLRGGTTDGNGLVNLQERMVDIGGHCRIQTSPQGTLVVFSLPI
jgi:signal transduction histidine kinase